MKKTKKAKTIVDKSMTFSEIMQKNPEAAMILMEEGMHCAGCHLSAQETLEQGAMMHGINPDRLVKKLNKKSKSRKAEKKKK